MKTDIQNKNITQSEKELFELFINTHKKYIIKFKKINIEYYYSGKGENTILSSMVTREILSPQGPAPPGEVRWVA